VISYVAEGVYQFYGQALLVTLGSSKKRFVTNINFKQEGRVMRKIMMLCSFIFVVAFITGCPQFINTEPIADAGNNQTVAPGASVTLNGAGSSDPDGDTLTYQWLQTGGTDVDLNNDDTAIASFTAPSTEETLAFQLTVDDGRTGTSTDSVTVTVAEVVPERDPVLFVANFTGNSVVSFEDPANLNGNISPKTNLSGGQTQLLSPSDIVVSTRDTLIVSNRATDAITSYDDAFNAIGNIPPSGNVRGNASLLDFPTTLEINPAEDLLFVANSGVSNDILVFSSASTSVFNGNLAPTRVISSTFLNSPFGINLDDNDNLYVANNGSSNVLVFANASNSNGTVEPQRTITSTFFTNIYDVCVCNLDNLYVVDASSGDVYIFNNASSLNGNVEPDFILTVQGSFQLTALTVDSNGIGYIVDPSNNAIYSYDNIANLNGTLLPDRLIKGTSTQLDQPIRVFLVE
jgi:hypothetical protein